MITKEAYKEAVMQIREDIRNGSFSDGIIHNLAVQLLPTNVKDIIINKPILEWHGPDMEHDVTVYSIDYQSKYYKTKEAAQKALRLYQEHGIATSYCYQNNVTYATDEDIPEYNVRKVSMYSDKKFEEVRLFIPIYTALNNTFYEAMKNYKEAQGELEEKIKEVLHDVFSKEENEDGEL